MNLPIEDIDRSQLRAMNSYIPDEILALLEEEKVEDSLQDAFVMAEVMNDWLDADVFADAMVAIYQATKLKEPRSRDVFVDNLMIELERAAKTRIEKL